MSFLSRSATGATAPHKSDHQSTSHLRSPVCEICSCQSENIRDRTRNTIFFFFFFFSLVLLQSACQSYYVALNFILWVFWQMHLFLKDVFLTCDMEEKIWCGARWGAIFDEMWNVGLFLSTKFSHRFGRLNGDASLYQPKIMQFFFNDPLFFSLLNLRTEKNNRLLRPYHFHFFCCCIGCKSTSKPSSTKNRFIFCPVRYLRNDNAKLLVRLANAKIFLRIRRRAVDKSNSRFYYL